MGDLMDTALGKGLRVLEALANGKGPMRLSHLAADLDMQKSSVHRVLQTLVEAGYVTREAGTDRYLATLKIWEMGSAIVDVLPIKRLAAPVLFDLHRRTGETVSLSVLDGDDVVYLDKVLSPRPMGFTTRVGSRVAAPMTVGGRAMLALEPDGEAIVARVAHRLGAGAIDPAKVAADMRRARRDGYLAGTGRSERGVVGLAAPVRGPDGRAAAGLTVSAPVKRVTEARRPEIIDALVVAATVLGEAIGR